ncbi:LOW QUALITY PROTEIN: adenosine 5'-monophosphoramidase HINT1-like [Lagopus muta]|uniref:LOW QUALITY PROTEIN: adenosine 5'-monophosphoramidase HINT1-like n=1 Tax=Lagopus muta TaxID=64668 RepID=UPI00209DF71E|nr:LOW QUALITY PROTEIN: adenosine 5'-monophosphoramidase HINT1-like [Lagopus muta]
MAGGMVRSPAARRSGAALFGKVGRQEFSANVIREEEEPLWTRSALRSMIFPRKVLRFFLAARDKAVVRLSEAEDSGAPLHRRLMIVGEKCAANLGLTDGFRMAVRYPPSGPSDYRTRLCIGWPSVGPASRGRRLHRRSCCTRTDRHRMDFTCRPSV